MGQVTVSIDAGTQSAPVTYNAAANAGRNNFIDSVGTASYARITHCNATSTITISGLGSNHLVVANSGADVVLTVNASGIVSQITVVGVTSPSAIIGSLSAFNSLGVCVASYN